MVSVRSTSIPLEQANVDAVVLSWFQGLDPARQPARALERRLHGLVSELVQLGDFKAKLKESRLLPTRGLLATPRVLLLGLGKPDQLTIDGVRELAARAALAARDARLRTVALPLFGAGLKGKSPQALGQAMAEGVQLGLFEFREYKSNGGEEEEPRIELSRVEISVPAAKQRAAVDAGVRRGTILAECTNLARTLIARPSLAKAPQTLAAVAQAEAKKARLRCTVLGPADLKRLGLGALLGVGAGSTRPPCLVVLEHRGGKKRVLLCGKGIVFDSGGINIKPSEGMERMKYDMSGSAAVLGALLAAARLKLPVTVIGILALAENLPSGSAIRPGDVLVAHNRKTIEVVNTDAEGRLVLADALSYGVARFKPDYVADIATLTGAVRVALGGITGGLMGNDDALVRRLIEAGKRTGDDLWQLPLHKGYEKQVQSDIADVKNMGVAGLAGAIAGAAFLKQFVDSRPWVHLDIAGTAWTDRGPGDLNKEYLPKGPTGIGVRLLTEWLSGL